MQKAEAQQSNVQKQAAAKQTGGNALATAQSEDIAQLEAMLDSSPQMEKAGNLAAMMSGAPAMSAQRKMMAMITDARQPALQRRVDLIHNSPQQQAAQKHSDRINLSPMMVAQRQHHERLFGVTQRAEDDEALQGKFASEAPAQLEQQAEAKPNNTGLPDSLKSGIESLSGMSMDNVKVHYNSSQPAQLNALAYAQGADIHVAPGQEQHLPHEAWHVVQQAQGRVKPTMQVKGTTGVNDDPDLEQEADIMGEKALQLRTALTSSLNQPRFQKSPPQLQPIQRMSEIPFHDWAYLIKNNEAIKNFPPFAKIIDPTLAWDEANYNLSEDAGDLLESMKSEIEKVGNALLSNESNVDAVYVAIKRYFPNDYLSKADVAAVKTYNFDGPIVFSAENVMAWMRLAGGAGTVDDLRYIHHEIYEIKKIQKTDYAEELTNHDPEESFWESGYEPAHESALRVEVRFLTEAVNRIYQKNYSWIDVVFSDKERTEEFKPIAPKDAIPSDHTHSELTELLTTLKNKKLGAPKPINLKSHNPIQRQASNVEASDGRSLENQSNLSKKPNLSESNIVQRQVDFVEDTPPAQQTIDVFEQILEGRILFGLTSPVLNGQIIGGPEDFVAHVNKPDIQHRQLEGETPVWESRIAAMPTNLISYNIRIPVASRWQTSIAKSEINRLFRRLHQAARFNNLEGDAKLELLPQPNAGAYYIHIFKHEENHAEDILVSMGFWLEDWDLRFSRVMNSGWGYRRDSQEASLKALWDDVGRTPAELAALIGKEMARDADDFHGSVEGAAPAFANAQVYEDVPRATIEVSAIHRLTF